MERAQRVLTHARQVLRLRRFALTLAGASGAALGLAHLARGLGLDLPGELYLVFPLLPVLALFWPIPLDRRLFWVGRRLGLGGRLAGLSAALKRGENAFLEALLADLRLPLRRLFFPEVLSLFPPVLLGALLVLGPVPRPVPLPAEEIPFGAEVEETEEPGEPVRSPEEAEGQPVAPPEIPVLPPGFSASSPYSQLFAALFGEEVSPEEAVQRLAQEEGRLRRLAELLGEAQTRGLSPQLAEEIGEIVEELARPDVRQALSENLAEGEEGLTQAEAAVTATLEGLARLQEEIEGERREGPGLAGGMVGEEWAYESPELWGEILPDIVPGRLPQAELERGEESTGLGIGTGEGAETAAGTPEPPAQEAQAVPAEVRPGEGPVRTGFQLALPGEPPTAATSPKGPLSPQEVELFLREATLPPELREVVRRYFELLARGEP